jgi:hypothetical protein
LIVKVDLHERVKWNKVSEEENSTYYIKVFFGVFFKDFVDDVLDDFKLLDPILRLFDNFFALLLQLQVIHGDFDLTSNLLFLFQSLDLLNLNLTFEVDKRVLDGKILILACFYIFFKHLLDNEIMFVVYWTVIDFEGLQLLVGIHG